MAELSPPLLVVLGATATGKSELAVELAERLGGEVLSCDASCVYRGLDVGTAKPDQELRARVPHHLLDLCEAGEDFTAARWLELAEPLVERLGSRGRVPVVAGGTGLYLRLLLQGLADSPAPDGALRGRLEGREALRPGSLHRLLRRLDPVAAAGCPPGQTRRLVRALEHRLRTGRRLSEAQVQWDSPPRRPAVKIGLHLDREDREKRIRRRIDTMLSAGWVDEVESLLGRGLDPRARSFRAIGYREIVAHLAGELSLEEARERTVVATRQYAKRQDTWFRREPDVSWFESARSPSELPALVERVMMTLRSRLSARELPPPSTRRAPDSSRTPGPEEPRP